MIPKRKLLVIEWDDHCSHGDDWKSPKSVPNAKCRNASVGWLLAEGKEVLTLASSFAGAGDEDELVCGPMTILKKAITARRIVG